MSAFLKYTKIFLMVLLSINCGLTTFAQCNIIKTSKNNIDQAETPEKYVYLRQKNKYDAIAIKTILIKKGGLALFYADLKYTGSKYAGQAITVSFKLQNDVEINCKLKFLKTFKIDDVKLATKFYEIELTNENVSALKQAPIKAICINKASGTVVIPVTETSLIQDQINCLQNEVL